MIFDPTTAPDAPAPPTARPADSLAAQVLGKLQADAHEEPPINYVNQAAEQNKDTVIRNVEALLKENFQSDGKAGQIVLGPVGSEQFPPSPYQGIHKFFQDDVEANLIHNVAQVLARAHIQSDLAAGKIRDHGGTIGILDLPAPKEFWHSSNEKVDITRYVGRSFKAYNQDPKFVSEALTALEKNINGNMQAVNLGQPLEGPRRDAMRQFAENAALIKLAVAEAKINTDPQAAKEIINGKSGSVIRLIGIASDYGANKENIDQMRKMAEEIAGR